MRRPHVTCASTSRLTELADKKYPGVPEKNFSGTPGFFCLAAVMLLRVRWAVCQAARPVCIERWLVTAGRTGRRCRRHRRRAAGRDACRRPQNESAAAPRRRLCVRCVSAVIAQVYFLFAISAEQHERGKSADRRAAAAHKGEGADAGNAADQPGQHREYHQAGEVGISSAARARMMTSGRSGGGADVGHFGVVHTPHAFAMNSLTTVTGKC